MKSTYKKFLTLALIFALALAADEATTSDATAESPEASTSSEPTTGTAPPTPAPTTSEASSSEGFVDGEGECTKDHCYYCRADDDGNEWCERCGNGMVINGLSGPGRKCDTKHEVEHCRESPVDDETNAALCSKCERGFGLKDGKCEKLEIEDKDCNVPALNEAGEVVCQGCENKFLSDDEKGCGQNATLLDTSFPDDCMYGHTEKSKRCNTCRPGFHPSLSKRSCEEEKVTGCKVYHPNEPQKCLICNEEEGFYAVGANKDGINIYQECKFNAWILNSVRFLVVMIGFGIVF